jgi:dephospho-CoA kinase
MKPTVLILVGLPGSGKTTASDFLKKKNFFIIRLGDLTDREVEKSHLSQTSGNEKYIRNLLRDKYGSNIYALDAVSRLIQKLKENKFIVIEGMKSQEEMEIFKKIKDIRIKVLEIKTAKKLRYLRLVKRDQRPLTARQAEDRDNEEIGKLGINRLKKISDFTLNNNEDFSVFYSKLERIVNNIINDQI